MGRFVLILFVIFAFFSFESQVFSQTSTRTVTVTGSTNWSTLFGTTDTSPLDIVIKTADRQTNTLTIDANVNCRSLTIGKNDDDDGGLTILLQENTINVATNLIFYSADESNRHRTIDIGAGTLLIGGNFSSPNNHEYNSTNSISISTGTLKVGGDCTLGTRTSFSGGSGLVEFTGASEQTLPNIPYANLCLSGGGTKRFPALARLHSDSIATSRHNPIWTIQDLKIDNGTTVFLDYDENIPKVADRAYRVAKLYLRENGSWVGQDAGFCRGSGTRNTDPHITVPIKAALGSSIGLMAIRQVALPVTLGSFSAKLTPDNKVSLGWVTSTERFNRGFRIERQAGNENGKFEQIGFVASKAKDGNSQNNLTYNFIDAAPILGSSSFYRFVQEDLDRKLTYSEVRVVKLNGQSVSMVFPNPSNGPINISRTADGKKINIQVVDQSGKIISQANNITDANYRLNIPQSGVYTIKISYPETGEQSIQRIVVQK